MENMGTTGEMLKPRWLSGACVDDWDSLSLLEEYLSTPGNAGNMVEGGRARAVRVEGGVPSRECALFLRAAAAASPWEGGVMLVGVCWSI